MTSSVTLASPPLRWTEFEFSSFVSRESRSRVNFRRVQAGGVISCDHSCVEVRDVCYRPPGTQLNILNGVSFSLPEKSFGLIFGQSGSGKTTLLQLLAGLSKPTSGSILVQRYGNDGKPLRSPIPLPPERVGIVFQFPERYFVADNVLDEVIFGWPRQSDDHQLKEYLALNLQRAINWVGLSGVSLDKDPQSLSGGYKRRLALAIQLVQIPDLLILDEPLAGLESPQYTAQDRAVITKNDNQPLSSIKDNSALKKMHKTRDMAEIHCKEGTHPEKRIVTLPRSILKRTRGRRHLFGPNHVFLTVQASFTQILLVEFWKADWKARADVVKLLKRLKKELTILVVSHDLRELVSLVDRSWRMDMGGVLREEPLPV